MCGIFGILTPQATRASHASLTQLLEKLYVLSETRGKESAGLHAFLPTSHLSWTTKSALRARDFIRSAPYKEIQQALKGALSAERAPLALLAHSRLVTNGTAAEPRNNQPVRTGEVIVIHNGIVVNVGALWEKHPELTRTAEVDTEIISALLAQALDRQVPPAQALVSVFRQIRGAASVACVHDRGDYALLATNTGDLYYALDGEQLIFASERFILTQALKTRKAAAIQWLQAGQGLQVRLSDLSLTPFTLEPSVAPPDGARAPIVLSSNADESLLRYSEHNMASLKRCTRCILPETFPYIHFDDAGVCNYCHGYQPKYANVDPAKAKKEFIASLEKYRRPGAEPDVIVPFSGGRDSSYGLHLIKNEFGFKPITFTYDWGMLTDLARRNIARMCGQLGIQNILVSADLAKKRANIRKNVSAWLAKPDLGLVPLFMAGDKHFFAITNRLKQQTGIKLDLWCANPLENTDFKAGLCGIAPDFGKHRLDYMSMGRKLKMIRYYARAFLTNPRYLNDSLADTFTAFLAYYVEARRDFYFLFNHVVWNERAVNEELLKHYDWEISPDSPSTWRIGDGTAPFYNYIYVTANGYSEFDTFRSNQIREGMIGRDEALALVLQENHPRVASLRWYVETIGLDFNATIARINQLDVRGLHAS